MMHFLDDAPHDFVRNASERELAKLSGFVHRTFNGGDLIQFVRSIRAICERHGGLGRFVEASYASTGDMRRVLAAFREEFFRTEHPERCRKHVSSIERGASCKRLCMYFRWMVRHDDRGVDFCLWRTIPPSAQSYRVARAGAFEENGRVEVGIPTSPLAVDLTVEKEVVTVGPYARYAQKFLGVRGALSDKTLYSVKAARVALLDRDATTASEVPAGEVRATSYLGDAETFSRVPFDKRSLVDESLETAARNAANTLFAIRRHRMELITSEAGEHVFGAGLQAALAELDRQEQAYTELFLGKRVTTTSVERITVVPDAGKQKYILCRFSPDRGLLPGNDLTGDVVLLQLDKESDGSFTLTPASPKAVRTATYRVAADVVCTVYCGTEELTRATLPLFEFGRDVELALPSKK